MYDATEWLKHHIVWFSPVKSSSAEELSGTGRMMRESLQPKKAVKGGSIIDV